MLYYVTTAMVFQNNVIFRTHLKASESLNKVKLGHLFMALINEGYGNAHDLTF